MKSLCVFLFVVGLAALGRASVVVGTTRIFEWDFLLSATGTNPPGAQCAASIQFNAFNTPGVDDEFQFEFYENSVTETPFILHKSTGPLNGFFVIDSVETRFFQDAQGVLVVRVLQGSVDLGQLYVSTRIGDERFSAEVYPTEIPEPGSTCLFTGIGGLMVAVFARRRRNKGSRKVCQL